MSNALDEQCVISFIIPCLVCLKLRDLVTTFYEQYNTVLFVVSIPISTASSFSWCSFFLFILFSVFVSYFCSLYISFFLLLLLLLPRRLFVPDCSIRVCMYWSWVSFRFGVVFVWIVCIRWNRTVPIKRAKYARALSTAFSVLVFLRTYVFRCEINQTEWINEQRTNVNECLHALSDEC